MRYVPDYSKLEHTGDYTFVEIGGKRIALIVDTEATGITFLNGPIDHLEFNAAVEIELNKK